MLRDAQAEYTAVDLAAESRVDPFAADKVVRLESAQAVARTHESIRYGETIMDAIELCDKFKAEIFDYMTELEIAGKSKKAQTP